jgi:hypothetical protein
VKLKQLCRPFLAINASLGNMVSKKLLDCGLE